MNRLAPAVLLLLAAALPSAASDGAASIAAGDAAFGDLAPGETDCVALDGVEGVRLSLDLSAAFPPRLLLRDPDGFVADPGRALRANSFRARLRNWPLPKTGRWTVEVSVDPAGPSLSVHGKKGDDDSPDDDPLAPRSWRLTTSLRAPRKARGAAPGIGGEETAVSLGVLPGGATVRVKASGGTLAGLEGPGGTLSTAPGRKAEAVLPATGEWSALVVPSRSRTVRVKAKVLLPRREPTEREALDDDGEPESDDDLVGGTVLVRLREGSDEEEFEERHGGTNEGEVEGLDWIEVTVPAGVEVEDYLESIGLDDDVVESEPVLVSESPEGEQSNVAFTASDATRSDVTTQEGFVLAGVLQAQGVATGQGVVIALVDTGIVAGGHPDLVGRLLPGRDFVDGDMDPTDAPDGVDNDGDLLVDEGVGHGTFIAGIVAAVAPGASILPVRVLDSDARGSSLRVARGIVWAVNQGARVVNLSLGVRRTSGVIQDAIHYARKRDVLVVAAAGNAGRTTAVTFPGGLSDVLTVTAVNGNGVRAPFANVSSRVDLAAPGVDVLGPFTASGYAQWSGTSFAAPFASAGAAMVLSRKTGMKPVDAGKALVDTAVSVDALNPGLPGVLGRGRLHLPAAVGQ